jgi:hypothetical protein
MHSFLQSIFQRSGCRWAASSSSPPETIKTQYASSLARPASDLKKNVISKKAFPEKATTSLTITGSAETPSRRPIRMAWLFYGIFP